MSTKPIVVGIDGTPASDRALEWALDEAVVRGCPLHVVHAWTFEALTDWTETTEQRVRAASEALLEKVVRTASEQRQDLPEIVRKSLRGDAAETLEKASEGAAMLVVASHTGHRIRQMVLGSTSMHVVRHAHAPIVVIPVNDRELAETAR
ncbi:universal stress protein [Lentzea flaviverrucosa]|uniref:Nucleotide-binding universal stress protein, UspA family n=1 Tax=Lentzea flaviverrucosa TaxID=200379 RepID=A0A1H9XWF0_9PSEU|nr:universal stress protein [Lentzea flaviverrucosa]RDI34339.1 nucleotide-binding universal stress UspA family protein [Lentzea flaviverrucosa]SES50490.1 Nucleotide-binding universal stress protein, UspA family [Lentzea flaviverrucosa]